jgi:hypothetical protein
MLWFGVKAQTPPVKKETTKPPVNTAHTTIPATNASSNLKLKTDAALKLKSTDALKLKAGDEMLLSCSMSRASGAPGKQK